MQGVCGVTCEEVRGRQTRMGRRVGDAKDKRVCNVRDLDLYRIFKNDGDMKRDHMLTFVISADWRLGHFNRHSNRMWHLIWNQQQQHRKTSQGS